MRVIFSAPHGLEVASTRYSAGDEEIDLVVKNNVERPFWNALDSPLLFVECKNWSSSVGASEVRDFEMKLLNHGPLARLGFFVAPGGFTEGARTELRRGGRSDHTVVLVDRRCTHRIRRVGNANDRVVRTVDRTGRVVDRDVRWRSSGF